MKIRYIAVFGAIGVAAIALIGAGAAATFNTTTTSNQTISAGTLAVVLYGGASGNGTPTITLGTVSNVGSSFTTGDQSIEMYNSGGVKATESTMTLGGVTTFGDPTLLNGLQVCVATNQNTVIYNGSLAAAISAGSLTYYGGTTITPGGADYYYVNIYAGIEPTMCGNDTGSQYADSVGTDSTSNSTPLAAGAQGESVAVSQTVGYTG
jgi:hypothetical protein